MFIRKVYYDLATGDIVDSHMRQGHVIYTTFEEDAQELPALVGRSRADTGCIEWLEPNAELEARFEQSEPLRVDISKTHHKLVFEGVEE